MDQSRITFWCHSVMKSQILPGGNYIDATMGNGGDTEFLCRMAGETGHVQAFDIQKEALDHTSERLERENLLSRATLILDGHEHMDHYADPETIDAICFNFGYLPGGNHNIATVKSTSIEAIEKGLTLLKHGAMMCLCIYSGGDTGFEEKDAILAFLKNLSGKQYTVIVNEYHNRENNPPMPVFIFKR